MKAMDEKLKRIKAKIFLLLTTLGVFTLFNAVWQGLELYFYGEVQPGIVDSIIGVLIFHSLYFNVKYWLLKWWANE